MYFVLEVVPTGYGKTGERNLRLGGFLEQSTAEKLAKRKGNCLIRTEFRTIVGQTIDPKLPRYVS